MDTKASSHEHFFEMGLMLAFVIAVSSFMEPNVNGFGPCFGVCVIKDCKDEGHAGVEAGCRLEFSWPAAGSCRMGAGGIWGVLLMVRRAGSITLSGTEGWLAAEDRKCIVSQPFDPTPVVIATGFKLGCVAKRMWSWGKKQKLSTLILRRWVI
jgi:hypothetical protein